MCLGSRSALHQLQSFEPGLPGFLRFPLPFSLENKDCRRNYKRSRTGAAVRKTTSIAEDFTPANTQTIENNKQSKQPSIRILLQGQR